MTKFRFSKRPTYIPKVQDGNIVDWGVRIPAVFVNALILAWRPSVASVKSSGDIFIVDPVTDRVLSNRAAKKNYKKLGYPEVEPEQLYSDVSARRLLIEQAVKNQLAAKADIVIAPYLFAEDTDDTKFSVNLTLLAETVRYVKEQNITQPLFAMICIGSSVLARPAIINHIIDRYNDDFAAHVEGFFVSVNDFNGRSTADPAKLLGFAHMVYHLSEYKLVIVKRIDGFGEVLCAIGAAGFSSGLATSETYSAKDQEDSKRKPLKRIYVPEIFDYLNDEEAKKVGYKCHKDSAAVGTHPESHAVKTKHYFHHKMERAQKMQSLTPPQRIDFMLREIAKGKKLAAEWTSKYAIPQKFLHASRWEEVLTRARYWKPSKQSDSELATLLEELEK